MCYLEGEKPPQFVVVACHNPNILPGTRTELTGSKPRSFELKQSYDSHWDYRFQKTYLTYSLTIIESRITFAIPTTERAIKRSKKIRGADFNSSYERSPKRW